MSEDFQKPLSLDTIKEKTDRYILNTYKRQDVAFYFGQGEILYDTDNNQVIDFVTGIAVNSLGNGEADIIEAIREQADRIMHSSNLYYNQEQALLAEVLIENSIEGKAFFCNSGAEANEAAFKLARRFGQEKGANTILALQGSFHGRTFATMSLTGQEKIHTGFGPIVSGIRHIPPNDLQALEYELTENGEDIAAIFMEPIQGEIGVVPLDLEYIQMARNLCTENNVLLIFDEIQTGIGRTGRLFAYENFDIEPDVFTLAKALGNGFPIGAMIVQNDYAKYLGPGQHGSTFGGNHLGARIAYETFRIIMTREVLNNVSAISNYIFTRLNSLKEKSPYISIVRGIGLHIGVKLTVPCGPVVEACRAKGLLINCAGAGDVVRMLPPLNIPLESTEKAMDIFEEVILGLS